MDVTVLRAFSDNFIFALTVPGRGAAAVVDPGDAAPVLEWCAAGDRTIDTVLITHHHRDHTGGLAELAANFPGLTVHAGAHDRQRVRATRYVAGGDTVDVLGCTARVIDVPGHTLGHVAYFFSEGDGGDVFTGDTVFGATIGHLFEGTPEQMFGSMRRLRALPPATRLWCAHEYTLEWVAAAAREEPQNARLQHRLETVKQQALRGEPTVPFVLEEEFATNPFFRWDDPGLQRRLGTTGAEATFLRLCAD